KGFNPGWNEAQDSLYIVEWPGFPMWKQQTARNRVASFQILNQGSNLERILALFVVEQHVTTEMRVTAQNLIRAFPRQHDFIPRVAHSTAQKIFGHAVSVEAESFRLQNCVGKMVCKIILPDGDRYEFCACLCRHLLCFFFFVVFASIES